MKVEPRLLSADDAARYVGVSPRTLSRLADRGDISRKKIGNRPKYEKADLDHYIDTLPDE